MGITVFVLGPPDAAAPAPLLELLLLALSLAVALVVLVRRYRSRRELVARAGELSALAEIGRALAGAPLEPEEVAEVAFQQSARILDTDFFQLGLFEGEAYRTLIWVRDGERLVNQTFALDPSEDGLIGWVRRNARPVLVRDFRAERQRLPAEPSYDSPDPPLAGVFAPLLAGDEVLGVVAIQSRRRGAFNEHHLRLLMMLAHSVASALALVGLKAQVEFRTLQLLLIQEISRRLISLPPLSELYPQVVTLIAQGLRYARVGLYECTPAGVMLRACSPPGPETGSAAPRESLAQRAVEAGSTLSQAAGGAPDAPQGPAAVPGGAAIAVPLRVEDRVLGVLELQRAEPGPFPAEHVALAETVAAHLALAALEARNFAQQQEEAWITTVLLEVARHAAAPGRPETALQAVLRLTTMLAGTTWAAVLLPEAAEGELRFRLASGLRRPLLDQLSELHLPPTALGLSPPYESETPLRLRLPDVLAGPLDAQEATAVTLTDGEALLGVLLIEGHHMASRRLSLLVGIAHQISLRLENTRLIDSIAAQRSLEHELSTARHIQESFLPRHLPRQPGWDVGATWRAARQVGGDFYDFIPLPPGPDGPRWGIVIADVADKGVPAALFMALCRTLLRSVAITRIDPAATLRRVNDLIFIDSAAELFVSVFYAVWEPDVGRLAYANGGHNPPLLFLPEQRPRPLPEHGMVLGVREGVPYETHAVQIPPHGLLLLYTDGVTEVSDSRGEFFGLHRLEHLVLGMPHWTAQAVADAVAERVSLFCPEADLPDDLTVVALQRVGA